MSPTSPPSQPLPPSPQPGDAASDVTPLAQGLFWDQLAVGRRFRTHRRTVREADLVAFIGVSGMFAEGFLVGASAVGGMQGRPVPGALTYAMIEGMIVTTMLAGTGLALLESHQIMHRSVQVGDTIRATVEITGLRPTREHGRAVVESRITVTNQEDACVMTYVTRRLLAGRPQA